MSKGHRHGRDLHPVRAAARALGMSGSTLMRLDQDGPRFVATILVWAHWFVVALTFVQLAYRPAGWPERYIVYAPPFLLLVAFNGMTHYRLETNRTITWRWILAFAAMDMTVVSAAAVAGGGFDHYFLHLLYHPPLAGYALVLTSYRMTMVCVTVVSVLYLAISLTVGEGIDMGQGTRSPCSPGSSSCMRRPQRST